MEDSLIKKTNTIFKVSALSMALVLAACGGGGGGDDGVDSVPPGIPNGGNGGSNEPTNPNENETYDVYVTSDFSSMGLQRGSKATVSARVVDKDFGVVSGQEVTFSITDPKLTGVFNTNTATVTTDESGVATINLEVLTPLTEQQAQYLKQTGVTVTATLGDSKGSLVLKGSSDSVGVQKEALYDVYVSTSKNQLQTGSDSMVLTIRVTDKAGGIKPNVPVSLALVEPKKYGLSFDGASNQTTNAQGVVTVGVIQNNVGLSAQIDHSSSVIVTVDDGEYEVETQSIPIIVSGTEVVDIQTSATTIGANDSISISGRLVNGNGNYISNMPVAIANAGNQIQMVTTDGSGRFEFKNLTSNGISSTNGVYNFDLIANPNSEATQKFPGVVSLTAVTSQNINVEVSDVVIGETGKIKVTVPGGANQMITLASTKGLFSNGSSVSTKKLNSAGKAEFDIESNVPGPATIETTFNGRTKLSNLNFVSISPTKLNMQASSRLISVNSSTELQARVLDRNDAPVANASVQFNVLKDGSGGQLSKGLVKTDSNGIAKVTYTSGGNSTASNGVQVEAKVLSVTLPDGTVQPIQQGLNLLATEYLTVQTTASTIGFGLSDKVASGPNEVYYFTNGSIFVTNNSGQPAANQRVTIALRPESYIKGLWSIDLLEEKPTWEQAATICANEDQNYNSILDSGEDKNGNGQLDPGYAATILVNNQTAVGNNGVYNLVTDNNGIVDFRIRYLKNYANWFIMKMTVATTVDGSESTQERNINFPVLDSDIDDERGRRPDLFSPFGQANSCTDPN